MSQRPIQPGDVVWAHHLPSKKDRPLVVLCRLNGNGYLLMSISSKPHYLSPRYQYHLSHTHQYEPVAPALTPLLKTTSPLGPLLPHVPDRKWKHLRSAGVPRHVRGDINLRTYDPCFIKLDDVVHVPHVIHYLTSLRPSDFQHVLNTFNSTIMPQPSNTGNRRDGGNGGGAGAGAGDGSGAGSGSGSGNGGGSVQKGAHDVEKADEKTWTVVGGRRRPDDFNSKDDDTDEDDDTDRDDDDDDEEDDDDDETPFLLSMIQAAGLDPYSYLVQTALHQPPTYPPRSQAVSPIWNRTVDLPNQQLSQLSISTSTSEPTSQLSISTSASEPTFTTTTTSTSETSKQSGEPKPPTSPNRSTISVLLAPQTPSPSQELQLDPPPTPNPEQALRHRTTLSTAEYSAVQIKRQAVQHIQQLLNYKVWSEQTIKSLQHQIQQLSSTQGSSNQQLQIQGGDATARGAQFDEDVQRLQALFPDAPGGPSS